MKQIPLTQGQVAIVDDGDYERLSQYRWVAQYVPAMLGYYAVRWVRSPDMKPRGISMHRKVLHLDSDDDREVHHVNHVTLDNRSENLRPCTHQQNMVSRLLRRVNSVGFRGVWKDRRSLLRPYGVSIGHKYLGRYASPIQGALVYNREATKMYGEFAVLNDLSGIFDST